MAETIKNYPPNYENIQLAGFGKESGIYAYKDKIYVPSGKEIPPDIQYHEEVHLERQKDNVELWWYNWIISPKFRQEEELIAYAEQVQRVREKLGSKAGESCLDEAADNLASDIYKLGITKHQAKTLIRQKARDVV